MWGIQDGSKRHGSMPESGQGRALGDMRAVERGNRDENISVRSNGQHEQAEASISGGEP